MAIGRTYLGLSALSLDNISGNYHFGEFTPDGVQWDRDTVTSPWVNFRFLVAARKRIASMDGELYVVTSGSASAHQSAEDTLLAALGQPAWTLSITTDGATRSFGCEMADVEPGESIMQAQYTRWTTYHCTIPCRPV
jgi:hypothetical protein